MIMDMDFLSKNPLFSSLSTSQLKEIAEHWIAIEKNAGEIIFRNGDPADTIYLIQKGSVLITTSDTHGDSITLSILNKEDMFGELTLFENTKRSATAKAAETTTLLKMPQQTFVLFLKKYPDIAMKLLAILSSRLRDTNTFLEQHTTRNVNTEIETKLSFGDRLADRCAIFIGSWTFIIFFSVVLVSWISLNTYTFFFEPIDRFPFILLNLVLSCLAAIQAPVIMMSQGRQAQKDHLAADLDYKINLKAELQIEEILARLELIQREESSTQKHQPDLHHQILEKLDQVLKRLP
jgi:CRP/FNR family cyclic AMP-dependent transcriptional regulator